MSLNGNNILAGASGQATGYDIDQSLRFDDGDSAYLSRTPSSAGNRKTWTWSGWVKRGNLGSNQNIFNSYELNVRGFYFNFDASTDSLNIGDYIDNTGWQWHLQTSAKYRDVGSWYHIVLKVDTTQSTSSDRVKLYVNGEQVTAFSTETYPSLNWDGEVNRTEEHQIGRIFSSGWYFDGYLAEMHFIDGTALDASSFGETNADTNQWVPIKYTGGYGTNGFYLKFQDSSALGDDSSGNTNDFTAANLAATDVVADTPTNNFATLNPLGSSTLCNFSEGNLKEVSSSSNFAKSQPTIAPSSGKWYAEYYVNTVQSNSVMIGAATLPAIVDGSNQSGTSTGETVWTINHTDAAYQNIKIDGTSQVNSLGNASAGDVLGLALDADNGKITFYKNNSVVGSSSGYSITNAGTGVYFFEFMSRGSGAVGNGVHNFGQDSSFAGNVTAQGNTDANGIGDFYYTPPSGYLALCSDNLSEPSIADPTAHFNTVTYSGNSSTQAITGVGHQPDFTWFKARNNAYDHSLVDSVRGVNKAMASNTTSSESGFGTNYTIDSFDSDGFTLHSATYNNASGTNYVAWNWKAGGTASSNTDGTITSSVSANTTAGFSVGTYTGDGSASSTVGTGLSSLDMVIIKNRDETRGWVVKTKDLTSGYKLGLDSSGAETSASSSNQGGIADLSGDTFSFISGASGINDVNDSGDDYVFYAFESIDGYSKVGKYTGNSNADGPMFYCGFKPSWVMFKAIDSIQSWTVFDNKRNVYNLMDNSLFPDLNNVENDATSLSIDFVSNGIKIRSAHNYVNYSGSDYLVLAFAESPFKTSNAR